MSYLPVVRHVYLTCKYLNIPTQGSPNHPFVAVSEQDLCPLHLEFTTDWELPDLQLVFAVLWALQMLLVKRPYIA